METERAQAAAELAGVAPSASSSSGGGPAALAEARCRERFERIRAQQRRARVGQQHGVGADDARLAAICRKPRLRVNSLHSQIVSKTGEGMTAVGWDLDGFIQASEHKQRDVIGVQWHPEYLFYVPSQLRLFRWLLGCR